VLGWWDHRPDFNTDGGQGGFADDLFNAPIATLETVAAVIAHSQIVVAQPHSPMPALPGGFEDLDIAVLDWIAVEGRRLGRGSCGCGPGG
jgi:hypothetical protein